MENICLVTRSKVEACDLKNHIERVGGCWYNDLDQGVIERGQAAIYVSVGYNLACDYEPDELIRLARILGDSPQSIIDIHIGHGKGSEILASEFARNLLLTYPGYVDDNISEIPEHI